jgi:hypothetical protein
VARLPLWMTGYRHVGREVFFSSLGGVRVMPRRITWRYLLAKLGSDLVGTYRDWIGNGGGWHSWRTMLAGLMRGISPRITRISRRGN